MGIVLQYEASLTLGAMVGCLFEQARKLQENTGRKYIGALMHHLVGAKLALCFAEKGEQVLVKELQAKELNGYQLHGTIIHVVANPDEVVLRQCVAELERGLRPMLVTTQDQLENAHRLADFGGLKNRVEIIDGPQFIAMNLYMRGSFSGRNNRAVLDDLIESYNDAASEAEQELSLLIKIC